MTHSVAMAVAGLIGSPNESLTKLGKNGQVRGGDGIFNKMVLCTQPKFCKQAPNQKCCKYSLKVGKHFQHNRTHI